MGNGVLGQGVGWLAWPIWPWVWVHRWRTRVERRRMRLLGYLDLPSASVVLNAAVHSESTDDLRDLERRGLVRRGLANSGDYFFVITDAGRRALEEWR